MDGQENQKHMPKKLTKRETEANSSLEKARADARVARAQSKAEEKSRLRAEAELTKIREAFVTVQAELEQERRARLEVEEMLANTREDLASNRAQIDRERLEQIDIESAGVKVDEDLIEAKESVIQKPELQHPPSTVTETAGATQRHSFVIRLTADERGSPQRTEIEHVQSSKKEAFPALDTQRIAEFIKTCTTPEEPLPFESRPEVHGLSASLIITCVELLRKGSTEGINLIFHPNEDLKVGVQFHLEGSDAGLLSQKELAYEIQILAQEVTQGNTIQLGVHRAPLVKHTLEYTECIQVGKMPPGIYRLVTYVVLLPPIGTGSYREGPIFQVNNIIRQMPSKYELARSLINI